MKLYDKIARLWEEDGNVWQQLVKDVEAYKNAHPYLHEANTGGPYLIHYIVLREQGKC